jgi:hypothetical protein
MPGRRRPHDQFFFDCDDSDGGYAAEVNDFSELL